MYKMKLELDYDKLKKIGYDMELVDSFLDREFSKRNIFYEEGFYVGDSYESFWGMILSLSKADWFINNLKSWMWYNMEISPNACEDLLEYYKGEKDRLVG